MLAFMYYNGEGVGESYEESIKWFTESANQGDKDAKEQLKKLFNNKGQNIEKAKKSNYIHTKNEKKELTQNERLYEEIEELKEKSKQGDKKSQLDLALTYQFLAEDGDMNAENSLATMYFNGIGVEKDYKEGTLKIIKTKDSLEFTNPGSLKIELESILKGGNSKSRNPRIQKMFSLIGLGDGAGSGFPKILAAWNEQS